MTILHLTFLYVDWEYPTKTDRSEFNSQEFIQNFLVSYHDGSLLMRSLPFSYAFCLLSKEKF